jgi:hypothetical protein
VVLTSNGDSWTVSGSAVADAFGRAIGLSVVVGWVDAGGATSWDQSGEATTVEASTNASRRTISRVDVLRFIVGFGSESGLLERSESENRTALREQSQP